MLSAQTIYEAVLALRADSTQLRTDLQRSRGMLQSGLGDLQSLATTLAPVFSLGGIAALTKQFIDLGDQLSDLSDRTQVSIELLGGIRTVAETNGSSLEAFAKGMTIAQRNLGDLSGKGKESAEALKALGLNVNELINLSPDEFIEKLVAGLQNVTNQNQRAAVAYKILGRAGVELVPTLTALAENGIKKISKEAAAGYRALDNFKDKMVEVTGEAANFWAALLGKGIKTDRQNFIESLTAEQTGIETLLNSLRTRLPESAQKDNPAIKNLEYRLEGVRRLREKLQAAENQPAAKPPPARDLFNGDAINKANEQARTFFDGLDKQVEDINAKLKEGLLGPGTAIGDQLDADFKRFKDKLIAEKLPIPAGLDAKFAAFKEQILQGNDALRTQKLLLDQLNSRDTLDQEEQKNREAAIAAEREQNKTLAERIRLLELESTFGVFDVLDEEQGKNLEAQQQRIRDLGQTLSDLMERENVAKEMSIALGSSFELTNESLSIQRQRVEALIKEYGALSPQVKDAVDQLKLMESEVSLKEVFHGLTDSVSRGIEETITGINEGSQTLSDGLRNMLRNVFLSLETTTLETLIINPLKRIANAFFDGLAAAFADGSDSAAEKIAKDLGRKLGDWLRDVLGGSGAGAGGGSGGGGILNSVLGSFSSLFSSARNWFGDMFKGIGTFIGGLFMEHGGAVPAFANGGPVLSFASGGTVPAMLHPGEVVLRRPSVQKMGMSNALALNATGNLPDRNAGRTETIVQINGDITPRQPNMSKDDVIKVVTRNLNDRGVIMRMFEQRTSIKGG